MAATRIAAWDRTLQAIRRVIYGEDSTTELAYRERLRFSGSGVVVADNPDANSIDVEISGTDTNAFQQGGNAFGAVAVLGSQDDELSIIAGGVQHMRMYSGVVGVGTSAPQARLHVHSGAAATTPIAIYQNSTGNFAVFATNATPESAITGSIGDVAIDHTGGGVYLKRSGSNTNTGWQRLATTAETAQVVSAEIAHYSHPGDTGATAQTTPARWFFPGALVDISNLSVSLYPSAAVTANNTNYATINLYACEDGGSPTLIASATTRLAGADATGNWAAYASVPLTFLSPPYTLPANTGLLFEILKASSGVSLGAFRVSVVGTAVTA